jgi:hypothetical protein
MSDSSVLWVLSEVVWLVGGQVRRQRLPATWIVIVDVDCVRRTGVAPTQMTQLPVMHALIKPRYYQ